MAGEITFRSLPVASGLTVYAEIFSDDEFFNTGTSQFETYNPANQSVYAIDLKEVNSSGYYIGDFPVSISINGSFDYVVYQQAGLNPLSTDNILGYGTVNWGLVNNNNNQLTTLSYVKDYGGITVDTYDTYLTNRIVSASAAVSKWCNRNFYVNTYVDYYDGVGSTILQLKNYPIYQDPYTDGIIQVTYYVHNATPIVVPGSEFIVNPTTGTISVSPSSNYIGYFDYDWFWTKQQSIQVEYMAGYSEIPIDIQEAVAKIVMNSFVTRGADMTMEAERMLDYNYKRREDGNKMITDDIAALLFPYKDMVV